MGELKQEFLDLCGHYITRDGNAELLDWLKASDFFTAPASTKYHGNHEGGLVKHSLNVYKCLVSELESEHLRDAYTREAVALVALFHDVCKTNFYKKGTSNVKENGLWVTKEIFEGFVK